MSEVKVSVTFRHTQPTDALKDYAREKIHRFGKYFSRPLAAHVVLAVESKECQIAEVELHAHGTIIHGKEQTLDLYSAIDLVMDKIERQIKKRKEKIKLNRRRTKA
ncbi:MAG: ribosome-associated translation inhibitor RaiA [Deltaproteobacteria bacterium]|nr:ribosome-associated translation inhibitor RaiA [Deltaproteobacteria bacterium]MBI2368552.1 ribosome-associated translation inhibitor RaiA [Deltaproteobacteria bacterium]MBI2531738.1 ribosome-associated translation inhibitor RaiA [Deltaproteobacteria bacterium]